MVMNSKFFTDAGVFKEVSGIHFFMRELRPLQAWQLKKTRRRLSAPNHADCHGYVGRMPLVISLIWVNPVV
jgi:hypothetical protein